MSTLWGLTLNADNDKERSLLGVGMFDQAFEGCRIEREKIYLSKSHYTIYNVYILYICIGQSGEHSAETIAMKYFEAMMTLKRFYITRLWPDFGRQSLGGSSG